MIKPYIVEESEHGLNLIKLIEGPFVGIIYTYGKVEFLEEQDQLRIKFMYDIHDDAGLEYSKQEFEQYIAGILEEMLYEGLAKNSLVYTGGVDEDRTEDIIESDSE